MRRKSEWKESSIRKDWQKKKSLRKDPKKEKFEKDLMWTFTFNLLICWSNSCKWEDFSGMEIMFTVRNVLVNSLKTSGYWFRKSDLSKSQSTRDDDLFPTTIKQGLRDFSIFCLLPREETLGKTKWLTTVISPCSTPKRSLKANWRYFFLISSQRR